MKRETDSKAKTNSKRTLNQTDKQPDEPGADTPEQQHDSNFSANKRINDSANSVKTLPTREEAKHYGIAQAKKKQKNKSIPTYRYSDAKTNTGVAEDSELAESSALAYDYYSSPSYTDHLNLNSKLKKHISRGLEILKDNTPLKTKAPTSATKTITRAKTIQAGSDRVSPATNDETKINISNHKEQYLTASFKENYKRHVNTLSKNNYEPSSPDVSKSDKVIDIVILKGLGLDDDTIKTALATCGKTDKCVFRYLITNNKIKEDTLYKRLANQFNVDFITPLCSSLQTTSARLNNLNLNINCMTMPCSEKDVGSHLLAWAPDFFQAHYFARQLLAGKRLFNKIRFTTPKSINKAILRSKEKNLLDKACSDLYDNLPAYSAKKIGSWNYKIIVITVISTLLAVNIWAQWNIIFMISICFSIFFAMVIGMRAAAFARHRRLNAKGVKSPSRHSSIDDDDLPSLSIIVPLYHEDKMLDQLMTGLKQLNYPRHLLEIKLIAEADDWLTQKAAAVYTKDPIVDTIIVPKSTPRSKPKALCYVLPLCNGDIIAVFDAEDIPHPNQARAAVAAINYDGYDFVQAPLVVNNSHQSWISNLFAAEYGTLFDILLPALSAWGMPVMLGGTSNYFVRETLLKFGGWDPYNLTEDADLGIRLTRNGCRCGVISEPTAETLPHRFIPWLNQRTRWLKGWLQTWIVHNRHPLLLYRQLGFYRLCAFHLMLTGFLLSAIIHPLALIGLVAYLSHNNFDADFTSLLEIIGFICFITGVIILGYALLAWISHYALKLRNQTIVLGYLALIPVYWLMVSLAAYRAVFNLLLKPFFWHKTTHTPNGDEALSFSYDIIRNS